MRPSIRKQRCRVVYLPIITYHYLYSIVGLRVLVLLKFTHSLLYSSNNRDIYTVQFNSIIDEIKYVIVLQLKARQNKGRIQQTLFLLSTSSCTILAIH